MTVVDSGSSPGGILRPLLLLHNSHGYSHWPRRHFSAALAVAILPLHLLLLSSLVPLPPLLLLLLLLL